MPVPNTPLETRLVASDAAVLDSLVEAWRGADRVQRDSIEFLVSRWWRGGAEWRGRLMRLAAESGDSVRALRWASELLRVGSMDSTALAFVLPLLEATGRLLPWGVSPDAGYEAIYYRLLGTPDVLGDARPACVPRSTCAMVAAYADREDVDPRLRELGVAVTFLLDPRGAYPRLEERARAGTLIAQSFLRLAHGSRNEISSPGTGVPFPEAGADWRAWLGWLLGRRGELNIYAGREVFSLFTRRTGRDFDSEFRERYDRATEDSARLVFGALRATLTPGPFDAGEIERMLLAGSEPLEQLAQLVVLGTFVQAAPAPDSVAVELMDAALSALLDSVPLPWSRMPVRPPGLSAGRNGVLVSDSLPAAVAARWGARIPLRTMAQWRAEDAWQAGQATTVSVRSAGNLALVVISTLGRLERPREEPPYFWAGSTSFVLLRTPAGWRYVSDMRMVT